MPPQPLTSANHGTDSGATGSPPTTAPEGAAAARATNTVSRQARVMDMDVLRLTYS
jgi:hypothetical protein